MANKQLMKNSDLISLIDHFPGGMIKTDMDGKILVVNSTLEKIFNKSKKDLIGSSGFSYLEKNAGENRGKVMKDIVQNKKSVEFIDYERGKWWKTTIAPDIDSNGKIIGFYAYFNDITLEMKKEEKKLLNQEEYYISMIENSMDLISIVDKQGKILYLSPSLTRLLKFKISERLNKYVFDNVLIDDKIRLKKYFKKMISKLGITELITYKIKDKDGIIHYFESIVNNQIHNPLIKGLIINSRDVTERELAKKNLERQKEFLDNVMNSTNEIIFTIDRDLRISYWNDAAKMNTGIIPSKIVNKKISKLEVFENRDELKNFVQDLFSKKRGMMKSIFVKSLFGGKRIWTISSSTVNSDENVTDVVFICRDVTMKDELHGKLIPGRCYLIDNDDSIEHQDIFKGLLDDGWNGLYITRDVSNLNLEDFIPSTPKFFGFSSIDSDGIMISDLESCFNIIQQYIVNTDSPVVNLDRIDYLIGRYGFHDVLNFLYKVNDLIRKHHGLLLVNIDTLIISKDELVFLYSEYDRLPSLEIKEVYLPDEEFSILKMIDEETLKHHIVNQKIVCRQLNISKVTAQKRTQKLLKQGLLISKQSGRSRNFYVTNKGKELLHQRKAI